MAPRKERIRFYRPRLYLCKISSIASTCLPRQSWLAWHFMYFALWVAPVPTDARHRMIAWHKHLRTLPPAHAMAEIREAQRQWQAFERQHEQDEYQDRGE